MQMTGRVRPKALLKGTPPEDLVGSLFTHFYQVFQQDPTVMQTLTWYHLEDNLASWPGVESFVRELLEYLDSGRTQRQATTPIHTVSLLIFSHALAVFWWQFRDFYARFYDGQTRSTSQHDSQFFKDALILLRAQWPAAYCPLTK